MRRIIRKHSTLAACLFPRLMLAVLVAGALLVPAPATHAAGTPEQTCQKGRYDAAAKYSACQQTALAKYFGGADHNKLMAAIGRCSRKYAAAWPKLQAKAPGSTCDTARFTDNGTTVTDNLTALQWEKKTTTVGSGTNYADPHDVDNFYAWSASGTAEDGTAFTNFLPALNSGGCFAGQCDWRLPTIYELQTILLVPDPCGMSPCIVPVFGPTVAAHYWSATTVATDPGRGWTVNFFFGFVDGFANTAGDVAVRAVRAGL